MLQCYYYLYGSVSLSALCSHLTYAYYNNKGKKGFPHSKKDFIGSFSPPKTLCSLIYSGVDVVCVYPYLTMRFNVSTVGLINKLSNCRFFMILIFKEMLHYTMYSLTILTVNRAGRTTESSILIYGETTCPYG